MTEKNPNQFSTSSKGSSGKSDSNKGTGDKLTQPVRAVKLNKGERPVINYNTLTKQLEFQTVVMSHGKAHSAPSFSINLKDVDDQVVQVVTQLAKMVTSYAMGQPVETITKSDPDESGNSLVVQKGMLSVLEERLERIRGKRLTSKPAKHHAVGTSEDAQSETYEAGTGVSPPTPEAAEAPKVIS